MDLRMLSSLREAGVELRRDGRGRTLAVISVGWLLGFGTRVSFPVLLPHVRGAFGVSLTTAGGLLTLLWLGYALGHLPGGYLGDRIGERDTLAGGMVITTAGVLGATVAPGAGSFFAGTAITGVGIGVFSPTRFTVLSDIYPDRDGTAMAVSTAAGNVGNTVLPVVAGGLAATLGWRFGLGYLVPLFAVTTVATWTVVPAHTSAPAEETLSMAVVRDVLRGVGGRSTLLAAGTLTVMSFVYQGFTGFYPTYLGLEGFDQATIATVYGLFFAAAIVFQPLAGMAADAFGVERAMRVVVGVSVGALAAVPLVSGVPAFVAVTLLLSVQLGFYPLVSTYLIATLPDEIQSSGLGVLRLLAFSVAATGPLVVGALADRGLFDPGLFLLAGLLAVAWGGTMLLPSPDQPIE